MKKSDELKATLEEIKAQAQGLEKADEITAKIEEIKAINAKISLAKMEEEQEIEDIKKDGVKIKDMTKINEAKDVRASQEYEDGFYNALRQKPVTTEQSQVITEVNNALSSGTGEDGGYLIPTDQQTTINELKRQYSALEDLVTVEPVSTLSGSRNMEADGQYTPFAEFTEDDTLTETASPQFVNVNYTIKDRGGILPVPNNLLADNKANLKAYLNKWLAKKSVATRNKLIADLLATLSKTAIAGIDDVKDIVNVQLDPAISAMGQVVMNQDAFNLFDKMKGKDGNYLMKHDVVDATKRTILGLPVKVYSNRVLPSVTTGTGETSVTKAPVIIGSLKEAVVLFDRQGTSVVSTNVGGTAFGKNRTEIRAITREDVKLFDQSAVVYGEIVVG